MIKAPAAIHTVIHPRALALKAMLLAAAIGGMAANLPRQPEFADDATEIVKSGKSE